MAKTRIYTAQALSTNIDLALESEASHHLSTVLRAKVGDAVTLFNGDGYDYLGAVLVSSKKSIIRITQQRDNNSESRLQLTLIQALCRTDRMDYLIQKSVELGVSKIVVVTTNKCQMKLVLKRLEKKQAHWQSIIQSACEQCGRSTLPEFLVVRTLSDLFAANLLPDGKHSRLILQPGARLSARSIKPALSDCAIMIGPESGFDDAELKMAEANGFEGLSLGPRILRTETAGPTIISILQALHGDLC